MTGRRMMGLDGLRGLAILAVMACHLTIWCPVAFRGDLVTVRVTNLLSQLWVGVNLFFALSGFLITGILLDARRSPCYFRSFYARRMLRIFPLYYGTLAAFFLIGPACGLALPTAMTQSQGWLWAFAANFANWPDWRRDFMIGGFHLEHFWTLAVEEQFYLLWPAAVLALGRRGLAWASVGLVVAAPLARAWLLVRYGDWAAYVTPICQADSLAIGSALVIVAKSPGGLAPWVPSARIAVLACPLAYAGIDFFGGAPALRVFGTSALAVGSGALVILGASAPRSSGPAMALGCLPLRLLGRYSYGLYVLHGPLMPAFLAMISPRMPTAPLGIAGLAAFQVAGLAFMLAVAIPVYHLVEAPFLRLKRFFPNQQAIGGDEDREGVELASTRITPPTASEDAQNGLPGANAGGDRGPVGAVPVAVESSPGPGQHERPCTGQSGVLSSHGFVPTVSAS